MKVSESMPLKENINSFQNQVNRELRKKQRSEDKEGGGAGCTSMSKVWESYLSFSNTSGR